jgi:hypothetical protein
MSSRRDAVEGRAQLRSRMGLGPTIYRFADSPLRIAGAAGVVLAPLLAAAAGAAPLWIPLSAGAAAAFAASTYLWGRRVPTEGRDLARRLKASKAFASVTGPRGHQILVLPVPFSATGRPAGEDERQEHYPVKAAPLIGYRISARTREPRIRLAVRGVKLELASRVPPECLVVPDRWLEIDLSWRETPRVPIPSWTRQERREDGVLWRLTGAEIDAGSLEDLIVRLEAALSSDSAAPYR